MTIQSGQKVPKVTLRKMTAEGPEAVETDEFFAGRKVVVFGVPGAFTPTCSAKHVPSYVDNAAALKDKGVDEVACISVNDPFVMAAWEHSTGSSGSVTMLADGNGDFAKATGLDLDISALGLGTRSTRYALVVDDGTVTHVAIEESPAEMTNTSAESVLKAL